MHKQQSDSREYLIQHGIIPIVERRESIIALLPADPRKKHLIEELDTHKDFFERFEVRVRALPEVKRLERLSQLGGKDIQLRVEYSAQEGRTRIPSFHTRFNHSELNAELAKIAGLFIGLPFEQVLYSMLAGWWHDIGHSAFSHTGDELLKAAGRKSHEERTVEIVARSPTITSFVADFFPGRDPEQIKTEIIEIIKEYIGLGNLQSIFDTLSYLIVDRAMIHEEEHERLAADIIADLVKIDEREKRLQFFTTKSLQYFMNLRARWMAELSNRPNKRTDEALRSMLRLAVEKKVITLDDIQNGVDDMIKLRLQAEVERLPALNSFLGLAENHIPRLISYHRLYQLSQGYYDSREWDMWECKTHEEALLYIEQQKTTDPNNAVRFEQVVVLEPFDYTKKVLPMWATNMVGIGLDIITVQANEVALQEDDAKYFVYIPKS